ncbi:hypothetical protein STRPO_1287 [Streptococcus porcinus str. Jelinkova 176]|uniref:Cytoplasmic protein n=3 Tax=Streptococcus porcinus TaxID=1340 RepID=A0ABP2KZF4_STRPO|nr:hypothetical protein STRPO_1287 [Streptococcus porcinus str. Jelinkova 176]SQG48665.1 hypothetical cytosolic protein [Streptococcus porcinus]VTT46961.1 hypothetical cytosolic protein [Streptococcus porcinus]VTT47980.1 hypothetical cytosolic protein [Streptococcus porcinus]
MVTFMKRFEAFKETLSADSLKAIYEETKMEVANDEREGTEAFSAALATQMAINLIEKYHDWLNENPNK